MAGLCNLDFDGQFRDRGTAQLKGVPGEWRLFAVHELD